MRALKHAAPQSPRRRGLTVGIPLVLVAVVVLACLALAFLPESEADAGRPAAASVGATSADVPSAVGSPSAAAAATTTAAQPSVSGTPKPSASGTPQPSATSAPRTTPAVASLAGRIKPAVAYHGVATAYDAGDGSGACLYNPSSDHMIAAMNHTDYESSKACGAYVRVRAANGASITVRIVNECPLPCAPGQLDLSHQAFGKLADLSLGRLPITWTLLSPGSLGTISLRYKAGSTRWWCGIQVIGHRNPVAVLEVRTTAGWRKLSRTDYNFFLSTDGSGCGGAIRVTDIYGEQLTVEGIALKADVVQSTRVQFARH